MGKQDKNLGNFNFRVIPLNYAVHHKVVQPFSGEPVTHVASMLDGRGAEEKPEIKGISPQNHYHAEFADNFRDEQDNSFSFEDYQAIKEMNRKIWQARGRGEDVNILIHCINGQSRSPAVAALFVYMQNPDLTMDEVFEQVEDKTINHGMAPNALVIDKIAQYLADDPDFPDFDVDQQRQMWQAHEQFAERRDSLRGAQTDAMISVFSTDDDLDRLDELPDGEERDELMEDIRLAIQLQREQRAGLNMLARERQKEQQTRNCGPGLENEVPSELGDSLEGPSR